MKGMNRSHPKGAMRAETRPGFDAPRGMDGRKSFQKKRNEEPSDSEEEEDEDQQGFDDGNDEDDEDEEEDEDDEEDEEDEDEEDSGDENDFSNLTFEELVRLKKEMGVKAFEKVRQRQLEAKKRRQQKGTDGDSSEDENNKLKKKKKASSSSAAKNSSEREKDAPIEITSKKPVSRFRQVIEGTAEKRRDPRFSNLHGHLNQDLFEKSYTFLDDYKEKELQMTRDRIRKEKDPEMRDELLNLMSTQQQDATLRGKEKEQKTIKSERLKKEREAVKMGKKPFYLKKSDEKREELAKKFQELKSAGRLEKFMEKRRKKNSNKEHRFMPGMRREGD